jgi:proline dehydrogenase
MSLMRSVLLAGSQNAWLRERATRYPFVRRSVSRFMPGEKLEDALRATAEQGQLGVGTILTQLGENLTRLSEAGAVREHYKDALQRISAARLDAQVSVKLTQLGLDLDQERCLEHLLALLDRALAHGNFVWIDMEASNYVDATLEIFRRVREKTANVGLCLQAYLRRTPHDLEALLPLDPAIRLVKGAYMEPKERAYSSKREVDESFYALSKHFLTATRGRRGALLGIATHDPRLVERLQSFIAKDGIEKGAYEFEMLYGIQRALQRRLVAEGRRLRVLISYGEHWFPWYMRRLAERPANVWFVARNLLS